MEGLLGKILDNTYRIDRLLGKGGMGAVYQARDISLNRDVAIKVMHAHYTDDDTFRARFLQEARAIAALDHPGIVQVYAFGQDLGQLYIVMDFIPGQTLQGWLKRLAGERKIIALSESLTIVRRVAWALHFAHEKGVLHRDIKPANIMLKPTDPALREPGDPPYHPVLTDFGLAKLAEGGVQTRSGTSMGTPAYMSPEQCLGLEPDRRADIYALGVVLFQLTTGRVPFDVKSLTEAIRRHTQEPPPPPRSINPSLPGEVENLILRSLAKKREDRFATAREMSDALKTAIERVPAGLTVAPTIGGEPATGPGKEPTAYVSLMTRMAEESVPPGPPSSEVWDEVAPASQLGASLIVASRDGQSRRISLGEKRTLTVGRVSGNDIVLPDPGASRHHARIEYDGQAFTVTDLNSTNGTFLGNSRLLPGVGQPWPSGAPLRIGAHWIKYEMQTIPGPSVLGGPSMAAPGAGLRKAAPPAVILEPQALSVEAGQPVAARLRILNQGGQVDHFSVGVDGIPPTWVTLPKEPLRLTPNEEGIVPLSFHPPRDPRSTAGQHLLSLRAISQADPRQVSQVSGTLNINPFHEFAAEIAPKQITTGRARLGLANRGNTPAHLTIAATDPAEALTIRASPPQLTLQAGERQTVPLEARPKKGRPWLGLTQRHPFELAVTSAVGQTLKQGGTLIVKPRIPPWVIPLLGLLLVVACALAGVGYKLVTDNLKATATAETATVVAAVTLTAATDSDGDGLVDAQELQLGTDPLSPDTDGDGLGDKEELDYKTKPTVSDSDGDGLADGQEIAYGTNPLAVDSDGDTLPDGQEVHELGTSPINPDTDGDGANDNVDPDPGQLPTLTPTPTFTPTPTGTPTPTPTGTHTPQPTDTITPTPTPTNTATPTPTFTPTNTPTPTSTPAISIITPPVLIITTPLIVVPLPPFMLLKRVAFIYDTNATVANAFKALIEEKLGNIGVTLIKKSAVASTDFGTYAGIIVGYDTGSGYTWADASAVNRITGSGKPVLGLGHGGTALFQQMGLSINHGNAAGFSQQTTIYVQQTGHTVFQQPVAFTIPSNRLLQIYHTGVNAQPEYIPNLPGTVSKIATLYNNGQYSTLSQQGKHILWSYEGGPDKMAGYGRDLFTNVVSYLVSQ